jgi:hypothetical protein
MSTPLSFPWVSQCYIRVYIFLTLVIIEIFVRPPASPHFVWYTSATSVYHCVQFALADVTTVAVNTELWGRTISLAYCYEI